MDQWPESQPGLAELAAKLAGGWKQLYRDKQSIENSAQPWQRPSTFEVEAGIRQIAANAVPSVTSSGRLAIVFLLDGSGSVTAGG